jgi:hypothetical protein
MLHELLVLLPEDFGQELELVVAVAANWPQQRIESRTLLLEGCILRFQRAPPEVLVGLREMRVGEVSLGAGVEEGEGVALGTGLWPHVCIVRIVKD